MPAWTPRVVEGLRPPDATAPAFTATLEADDINVVVAVPVAVSDWFGDAGTVPVCGLLDDVGFEATVAKARAGRSGR